jgi:SAM-dependent methyltransferase
MSTLAYAGMIPRAYHNGLGPMFFEPYAREVAHRLALCPGARVLETAAGTGIVTRHLLARLPPDGQLVASDIEAAMLSIAQAATPPDQRVQWRIVDACALPFEENSFDAMVCQFALMFFPDQVSALREARRVVKPGQAIVMSVWGSLAENPIAQIAHETVTSFFPATPPRFYERPFGLSEARVFDLFVKAGFDSVVCDTVDLVGESANAERAAEGLIRGTPVSQEIADLDGSAFPAVIRAVAERLRAAGGDAPMQLPMRARVFTALA